MSSIDVIRAWKDEEYRSSLSAAERAQLPDNPAGLVELSDDDLNEAAGGTTFGTLCTVTLPICFSWYLWDCSMVTFCTGRIDAEA